MPARIGKRIPRHIALLAAAAIPLALFAGVAAVLYFRMPSNAPPAAVVKHPEPNVQNSPAPQPSASAVARLTPPLRLDPFDVLAHAKTPDPALKAWLDNWQIQWTNGKDPDADQIESLNASLEKSPLDSVDMVALAHAFHHLSDDIPTTARFYDAASLRIESELNKPGLNVEQSLPVLLAINEHIEDFKHVLWPLIENRKSVDHAAYAEVLYRIYSNFVRCVPATNDSALIAAGHHPAIGAMECLYELGRTDEAKDSLEKMSLDDMTSSEKVAYNWIYGMVLYRQFHFAEAALQFRPVADDTSFQYSKDAGEMLVASLARTGDKVGAMAALKTAIQTHKYGAAKEIASVLALINGGRNNMITKISPLLFAIRNILKAAVLLFIPAILAGWSVEYSITSIY